MEAITSKNAQQDPQWKTCHGCDAVYAGEVCGKCVAEANRWSQALDRAIAEAVDILIEPVSGEAFAESSSRPGTLYAVSRTTCTCPAGIAGDRVCKHRAAYRAQCGELPLDPEPDRITFSGTSDRQEIQVDGRYHGFAAYADDSGWTYFAGRFPHARKRGTYCTLAELERDLEERLPVTLQIPQVAMVADLATAA